MFKFTKINSSFIDSIKYDYGSHDCIIFFTKGTANIYFNVPTALIHNFLSCYSKGKFYNDFIKGKFISGYYFSDEMKQLKDEIKKEIPKVQVEEIVTRKFTITLSEQETKSLLNVLEQSEDDEVIELYKHICCSFYKKA